MRMDYYFVAALCYVYLWRSTSGAQVAHSVRAKYILIVLLRKQFWKLTLDTLFHR